MDTIDDLIDALSMKAKGRVIRQGRFQTPVSTHDCILESLPATSACHPDCAPMEGVRGGNFRPLAARPTPLGHDGLRARR